MKKLGIVETLGISEDKFDEGVQYIEDNLPEGAVAEVYVFVPSKYGFSASTTTITALDVKFDGGCAKKIIDDNYDSNDDDYSNQDDGED